MLNVHSKHRDHGQYFRTTFLQDYKKKVEDLHAEVKKQQFKWKMAGEDIERVKHISSSTELFSSRFSHLYTS